MKLAKRYYQIIGKIIYWLALAVLVLVALFFLANYFPSQTYGLYVVRSGSMEPALSPGDVILSKNSNSYKVGDIITYIPPNKEEGESVTHRLIETKEMDGSRFFVTKGDSNDVADSNLVSPTQVVGKHMLSIPYLGFLVNFSRTLPGLILLIILPAIVIIFDEARAILRHLREKKKK